MVLWSAAVTETDDTTPAEGEETTPADIEVVDPEPETPSAADNTNGTVALIGDDDWADPDEGWGHQWLEFEGDKLAVRKPTQQALSAFSLASSRFVKVETKNDITGLFIARHLSPESYARVFSRLMDGDDRDYDADTIGELMRCIVQLTIGKPD